MATRTFVDTSALYALLDEDDENHTAAAEWFSSSDREPSQVLITHNYVLVESAALVNYRLGREPVRKLLETLFSTITCLFVDENIHQISQAAFLAGSRQISLVDRVSFEMMRQLGLEQAFAFDRDFDNQGFQTLP